MDAYRIMNGTHGKVWVDGEVWAELTGFQAKLQKNKSTINLCGQMASDTKITGVTITGSITIAKVYTRQGSDGDAALQGHDIRKTIVAELADPDAFGAERVAFYGVSLDDETIMDFATNREGTVTVPFTATSRQWLDKVVPE